MPYIFTPSVGTEMTESTIQGGGYTNLIEMPVEEIMEMLSNPTTPSLQYSERWKTIFLVAAKISVLFVLPVSHSTPAGLSLTRTTRPDGPLPS